MPITFFSGSIAEIGVAGIRAGEGEGVVPDPLNLIRGRIRKVGATIDID